ncbi:TPA: hypothetical protein NV714_003536 [Escherichia coli]|nr:hypothetical protein [Escherichia coli]
MEFDMLDEIDEINRENEKIKDNEAYRIIYATREKKSEEILVALVEKGKEKEWDLASEKEFKDLKEAYNYRDLMLKYKFE